MVVVGVVVLKYLRFGINNHTVNCIDKTEADSRRLITRAIVIRSAAINFIQFLSRTNREAPKSSQV